MTANNNNDTDDDVSQDDFQCDLCDRRFKSLKGVSIHKGYAHKKELRDKLNDESKIESEEIQQKSELDNTVTPKPKHGNKLELLTLTLVSFLICDFLKQHLKKRLRKQCHIYLHLILIQKMTQYSLNPKIM